MCLLTLLINGLTILYGTERNGTTLWGREMKILFILEILLSALFCSRFDCFIVFRLNPDARMSVIYMKSILVFILN